MVRVRINLLPREEKPSREVQTWNRVFVWLLIGAGLVIVIGVGIHIYRSYEIAALKSDIAETKQELSKYEGQAALVRDLTARRKAIEDRIEVIQALDKDRFARVKLLDQLARAVPEYVWLESCTETGGAVTVKGMAFSSLAISEFMNDLSASAGADSVVLHLIKKDEIENKPVLAFELGYKIPASQVAKTPAAKPGASKPREGAKRS
ncbi:MAG TPA: PilN domain-containing protein [bacterium]|nr:PilN domain-containing protein [bacterium]